LVKLDRIDSLAYGLVTFFFVFILIFGSRYHIIEELHSSERDGYVAKADDIRAGKIPRDKFRPLLYPILSAAAGSVLNDTFSGARAISSFFSALFILMTYVLGKLCFNKKVGLCALIMTGLNYNVIIEGVHVMTDMTFAAFTLICLVMIIRSQEKFTYLNLSLTSFSFSLAYFTRYTALSLIPPILVSYLFLHPTVSKKRLAYLILLFVFLSVLFLMPHFILTDHVFGNPFHQENWKNLAYKLYPKLFWTQSAEAEQPFDGLLSVIMYSPNKFVLSTIQTIGDFFISRMVILGGRGVAGIFFLVFGTFGLGMALWRPSRKFLILLFFFVTYIVMVSAFFVPFKRLMLPVLPVWFMVISYFFISDGLWKKGNPRLINTLRFLLLFIFFICMGMSTARELSSFIERHPVQELNTALHLQEEYGTDISVMGTAPHLGRYVHYRYSFLPLGMKKTAYFQELEGIIQQQQVDFILVGRLTLRTRPVNLFLMKAIPSYLKPIFHNEDVVLYKVKSK